MSRSGKWAFCKICKFTWDAFFGFGTSLNNKEILWMGPIRILYSPEMSMSPKSVTRLGVSRYFSLLLLNIIYCIVVSSAVPTEMNMYKFGFCSLRVKWMKHRCEKFVFCCDCIIQHLHYLEAAKSSLHHAAVVNVMPLYTTNKTRSRGLQREC
jgi:hypothetical protein